MGFSHWIFLFLAGFLHCGQATITLSSSVDGRQAVCPREVVTYTCSITQTTELEWIVEPFIPSASRRVTFFVGTHNEQATQSCGDFTSIQCTDIDFQAILTSVAPMMMSIANLTSTFTFPATARLNGRVVQCRGITTGFTIVTKNATLDVTGPPPPPQTPSHTVQQYGRDNVMLTVQWQAPQDDGGASVVNYTITVSPGLVPLTTTATSAMVTIPYNVEHTASIVATNCKGSSSTVIETIPSIAGCGAPSRPENGSVQSLDISQSTQEGSEIFFSCNTSYIPAENMTSRCASDGMWSPDPATFVCIFDCGPPPAPRNGSLESYTNTTEGSVVFYSCDPGFVPEMRMTSVCTVNGWSPNPGVSTCSVVNCGRPVDPQNGSIEPYQSTLGGAEIFFMCNPRFVPAGRMRANCTSNGVAVNGTWTPDPANHMCNASTVDCGVPSNASSGLMVQPYSSTAVSSVIFYQCQQSGFAPSSSSSVCGEDENWSPDPSQVVCRMIPTTTPTAVPTPTGTTPPTGSGTEPEPVGLSAGAAAAIAVILLVFIAVLVVVIIIVGVIWWRKRSSPVPKPPPQMDDVAMYSVVDDHPEKPAPYKGYMLKGPEAEYTTIADATAPNTSNSPQAVEAQYDLPPGSSHPEGLVYAEVNIKGKPSSRPRPSQPVKRDDDMVQYAAIDYQPKDAAEKSPPVVETKSKRMMLPDNPDDSVNLDNLLIQLKQVNNMWRELGDALGLPPSILDDISGQFQSDSGQCMVEMLDSWLMRHMHEGSPAWWEVAEALRKINHDKMADALETVYHTGVLPITVNMDEIPPGSLPEDTSSPPPIPIRGPLADEPNYPPPKPPRGTPEKKAGPPRPPRGSERKPKPEPSVPPRPPRAH